MSRPKPPCVEGRTWLLGRLKNRSALAPMTGQDATALAAFTHLLELYARGDANGRACALAAMHNVVLAMQPSMLYAAKAIIPYALDWSDEETLWARLQVGQPTAPNALASVLSKGAST